MRRIATMLLGCAALACAETQGAQRPRAPDRDRAAAAAPEPKKVILTGDEVDLRQTVERMKPTAVSGEVIAEALRSLAGVLGLHGSAATATAVLAPAKDGALERPGGVKEALSAAVTGLRQQLVAPSVAPSYDGMVALMAAASDRIDAREPLRSQGELVARALRAATNAAYLMAGAEAPFPDRSLIGPRKKSAAPVASLVQSSRSQILSLAVSRTETIRAVAADTLDSLADAVAALSTKQDAETITRVRLQAEKLRGATPLVFGQAAWVRDGLSAALDGLTSQLPRREAARLEPWVQAARKALDNIDEHGSLTFQRAPVQDGFRTVVDVLAVRAAAPAREPRATPAGVS